MNLSSQNNEFWGCAGSAQYTQFQFSNFLKATVMMRGVIVGWIILVLGGSGIYLYLTPPEYVATFKIILREQSINIDGPEDVRNVYKTIVNSERSETEAIIMKSERLLRKVFDSANIGASSEVKCENPVLSPYFRYIDTKLSLVRGGGACDERHRFIKFRNRVKARREAGTYEIDISYTAFDRDQALKVANSLGSAYITSRLKKAQSIAFIGKPYSSRRASDLDKQLMEAEEGIREGWIPRGYLPDADVYLVGPSVAAYGPSYPRRLWFMLEMTLFAVTICILFVLLNAYFVKLDSRTHSNPHESKPMR